MSPRSAIGAMLVLCALVPFGVQAASEPPASGSEQVSGFEQVTGFEQGRMSDGTEVGIWYPTQGAPAHQLLGLYEQEAVMPSTPVGSRLPLIVMSHGNGGAFSGHLDTAGALARAGFVVAALTHPGDNYRDQSRAAQVDARPAALAALIDHMLDRWPSRGVIDPARIGAFGFSSGGFTVLAAAGGRPDLSRMRQHCADHPAYYDCNVIRSQEQFLAMSFRFPARDARIRALVVAAPALGFTFGPTGLSEVTVPVQLWKAGDDRILPAPLYADAVRNALPGTPEFHEVPGAGHFDFLASCASGAPQPPICASAPGFDRRIFHQHFNAEVVRFLSQQLR